jgi:hypothetical protein
VFDGLSHLLSAEFVGFSGLGRKLDMTPDEIAEWNRSVQEQWEASAALEPPAEMAQLEPLLGEWTGMAEFLTVPEAMAEMFPRDENGEYSKLGAEHKIEWTLGGMFQLTKGWEDVGGGQKSHYVGYIRWDAAAGSFHGWAFNDMGAYSEGWLTFDEATRTFTGDIEGRAPDGSPYTGAYTRTIEEDDTVTWSYTHYGAMGILEMRGTDRRR